MKQEILKIVQAIKDLTCMIPCINEDGSKNLFIQDKLKDIYLTMDDISRKL